MPRDAEPAPLAAGATALGCPLDDEQIDRLRRYQAMLLRWNRVYNLTAIRDEDDAVRRHLLDSLSVVPLLDRHAGGRPLGILDVGSGGGLPGVVIAIARPNWRVTCVDTVAKKTGFIRQAAIELPLPNLQAIQARIEQMPSAAADVVVSRAFASLPDFTAWTRQHLGPAGVWLAMKGQRPTAEMEALPPDIQVFHVEHVDVPGLAAERCVVWMRPTH